MRVTALLMDRDLAVRVGARDLPAPGPGELLVGVAWAGICGSDLHVLRTGDWVAYWPATLGHEVAGRVLESRDPRFPAGTPVVLDSRVPERGADGTLRADRLSPDLQWLGEAYPGGFAEALVVPSVSARAVPESLDLADAVLAEPLAVTRCALDQVRTSPARVLVLGHGPIGALCHVEARRRWPDARVAVTEPDPGRAALARELGADAPGDGPYDLVIDGAGHAESLTDAVRHASPGGTVLLVALGNAPSGVTTAEIVERGLTLIGSVGFDDHHLDEAVAALAAAPARYRPIVSHRVPLTDLPAFLADPSAREDAIKVLVDCAATQSAAEGATQGGADRAAGGAR